MHDDCLMDAETRHFESEMTLKEIKLRYQSGVDRLKREQQNFKNYHVINENNEQKWLELMKLNFKL